jgi:hypothetical protein
MKRLEKRDVKYMRLGTITSPSEAEGSKGGRKYAFSEGCRVALWTRHLHKQRLQAGKREA